MFYKSKIIFLFLGIILALFSVAGFADASTIYANYSTGNDSTGAGTSENPYKTFYKAYTSAASGDTIDLTGTFTWTNTDETGDAATYGYTIAKDLTIQGQSTDATIIQSASTTNTADRRIFTISSSYTVTFKNLTLRYGKVSGYTGGGAVYIGTTSKNVTFNSCILEYNVVSVTAYSYQFGGGAIYYKNSSSAGQVIIENSIIRNNSAINGWGGAIWHNNNGTSSSAVVIRNTTINNNSISTGFGSALAGYYGSFDVSNSTITGNTGGTTIDLSNHGYGSLYLTNVTLAYNTVGSGGYGIDSEDVANFYIKNTIIAQNKTTGNTQQDYYRAGGTFHNNGYNLVETQGVSEFVNGTSGCIVGVQSSLNLSSTLAANDSENISLTLALTSGSVAINAGSDGSNGSVSVPSTDQRELPRVGTTDIGAYEYGSSSTVNYTLTYTAGSHGTISGTTSQTVASGGSGTEVTAVADTGYHFTSWDDGTLTAARTDTNVSANHTYTASFAINTYTLSYTAGSHGSLTGTTSQTVDYGGSGSAVTAVPSTGYVFFSWSDGSTNNPRTDANVTANIGVTASFTNSTEIAYVNSSSGSDSAGDGTIDNPYKTFNKGYTSAISGGTLDLTGTFTWTDSDETGDAATSGYTIAKDLTIQGHGPDQTILQAADADNKANRRVITISTGYTVNINDLAIRYGKITSSSADGGGILNKGTTIITDCEIYNNRASGSYGGGISNWNQLTLNNSTVYNNLANYMGGGIVNSYYVATDGFLNITNSTIVYNQVTATLAYFEGGGVHYRKGSGTITNSTIAYNTACGAGGIGMDDNGGTLTLKNNIIAKNIRLNNKNCHNGLAPIDFDFRSTGRGNVVDNGNNIVGYSYYYSWSGSGDWIGATSWSGALSWDKETFTLYGESETGSLNLDSSLAINDNENKTQTLALLEDSIAIDNGGSGANGTVSVPDADQRSESRSGSVDIGAFEYQSTPEDTTAPVIVSDSISATPSETGVVIEWSTDEESSSQVKYDPTTYLSTMTDIDSTLSIGHEVTLSGLVACSKYYYAVASQDEAGNSSISDAGYFMTTGCAVDVGSDSVSTMVFTPETVNGTEIDEASSTASSSDYKLSKTSGDLTVEVTIPEDFSETPASLQLKSLSSSDIIAEFDKPSSKNVVGSYVFDIKALADPGTTLSTFDSSVTISFDYSDADASEISESTLNIYRNDGDGWYVLDNCSVDADAKTVTCTTNNFSIFAIFGDSSVAVASSGGGNYASADTDGNDDIYTSANNSDDADDDSSNDEVNSTSTEDQSLISKLKSKISDLQAQISLMLKSSSAGKYIFNRDLYLGVSGEDVKELQKYFNNNGFELTDSGAGSKNSETKFFGQFTKDALIKFQKTNNISPAVGFFGPITRAFINK